MAIINIIKVIFYRLFILSLIIPVIDFIIPKKKKLWLFPSLCNSNEWDTNSEALLHYILTNKTDITIVRLKLNSKKQPVPDKKTICIYAYSWIGLWVLLRSGVIIIHHGSMDLGPLHKCGSFRRRIIANVWHGINIKGICFSDSSFFAHKNEHLLKKEVKSYHICFASSEIHRQSLSCSFQIPLKSIQLTGLPRNDSLLLDKKQLSHSQLSQLEAITKILSNKKLVLYAPTFRKNNTGIFSFTINHYRSILRMMQDNNFIFGLRSHRNSSWSSSNLPEGILNLNVDDFPDVQMLLRKTEILVTDYSGIWIDFLLMDRPIIGFCYDIDKYLQERGLIYDYENIFPGNIATNIDQFLNILKKQLDNTQLVDIKHHWVKRLFHSFSDSDASKRVFDVIRNHQI